MNKQGPGKIDWTDYTWNPVSGCWGPGGTAERPKRCFYCYAQDIAERFHPYHFDLVEGDIDPFAPKLHPERLGQPLKVKVPSKIFVCSTADLFGDWVPREWIEAVLEVARQAPQHQFQFLTKNPQRLQEFNPWPENAWVGATATGYHTLSDALYHLEKVQASVRFVSAEPLLESMQPLNTLRAWPIRWLIVGALTGRHAKAHPCRREWVEDIERAADRVGIPVFEKDSFAKVLNRSLRKEWPR